jgi:Glu-tRNA(Gln) amidotransferase subunit E-like FAD-binding protein
MKPMTQEEVEAIWEKVDRGAKEGVALALEEHYRMGRSIVVWRDEKVVWLKPEEYEHMTASGLGMTDLMREDGIGERQPQGGETRVS